MRDPIVVAGTSRTTSRLTAALLIALVVVALGFASLSYAYWRTTKQLDKVRAESVSSRVVLDRIQELAGLYAELARPDADRAAIGRRLAELADEIRASQQRNERTTSTTTTTRPSTTSSTNSTSTTTTTVPCDLKADIAGICVHR